MRSISQNEDAAGAASSFQSVKKVRTRQKQATNKKRFTESEDWILRSVFSPTDPVIARRARAPDAAIFNDAICHSVTNYGRAERCSISHFFVIGISSCFVLPCFATGCYAFGFKIATAAVRPRNDTKLKRFLLAAQGNL